MVRMHDDGAIPGLGHVAFRITRQAAAAELRVAGGLVAVLLLAIGVCGSVLPPRSGWLPSDPTVGVAVVRVSVSEGLRSALRSASARG